MATSEHLDRRSFLRRVGFGGAGVALLGSAGMLPAGSEIMVPRVELREPEPVVVPAGLNLTGAELGAGWAVRSVTLEMQHDAALTAAWDSPISTSTGIWRQPVAYIEAVWTGKPGESLRIFSDDLQADVGRLKVFRHRGW